ncbi:MAG: hypothetical protein ABR567_05700 [Myxococcales bacterium]|nr:hypothetical protein [Myxococcales bacterium]
MKIKQNFRKNRQGWFGRLRPSCGRQELIAGRAIIDRGIIPARHCSEKKPWKMKWATIAVRDAVADGLA